MMEMAAIESLVSELNDLCKIYIAQKEEFKELDRIREMFNAIKDQGYEISIPLFGVTMPEFELFSEEGQRNFLKIRDIERELSMKIKNDFTVNNGNQPFILAGKLPELVIFNDPDNFLITLSK